MKLDRIDPLVNDSEINYLADLFLTCFEFDRSTQKYRLFRNAVVVAAYGTVSFGEALPLLAKCACVDEQYYCEQLRSLVSESERPLYSMFNETYSPSIPYAPHTAGVTMAESNDVEYIVSFLGATFMYLLLTNYDKLGRVSIVAED